MNLFPNPDMHISLITMNEYSKSNPYFFIGFFHEINHPAIEVPLLMEPPLISLDPIEKRKKGAAAPYMSSSYYYTVYI